VAKQAKKTTATKKTVDGNDSPGPVSAWNPLRESLFRTLWIATIASNIGTWMQDVGESWLMTSLTTSPVLVALIETAGSLPVVLLALPAGALADIIDRRRLLLVMQIWMFVAAGAMGILAFTHQMTPGRLLWLTFFLGVGTALSNPVWQATTPELVSDKDLPAAITLNAAGINISRAIGPALGGFIVAASGPWAVFFLNAVSFIGITLVVYRWKPAPRKSKLPPEEIIGAMRAGTRYLRHSPELQTVLMRCAVFIVFASALWALLPQQARRHLSFGSFGYGLLLGCIGFGALVGAALLPKLRERLSINQLVIGSSLVFGLATMALGYLHSFALLAISLAVGGIAWLVMLASLNVSAQTVTPSWVRARVMAVYLLCFSGGLAAGSAAWGFVAARVGVSAALISAAVGLIVGPFVTWRFRLVGNESLSLAPTAHWPEPVMMIDAEPSEGPAITLVEYRIDPKTAAEFLKSMTKMRQLRLRDGAIRWNLLRDTADPQRYVETFVTESWANHLRQHERVTAETRRIEERIQALQVGAGSPKTTHLIAQEIPK
jgi:MFS family permease